MATAITSQGSANVLYTTLAQAVETRTVQMDAVAMASVIGEQEHASAIKDGDLLIAQSACAQRVVLAEESVTKQQVHVSAWATALVKAVKAHALESAMKEEDATRKQGNVNALEISLV